MTVQTVQRTNSSCTSKIGHIGLCVTRRLGSQASNILFVGGSTPRKHFPAYLASYYFRVGEVVVKSSVFLQTTSGSESERQESLSLPSLMGTLDACENACPRVSFGAAPRGPYVRYRTHLEFPEDPSHSFRRLPSHPSASGTLCTQS